MTPERWQQIRSVFAEVHDTDESERGPKLDELCTGDAELRQEVEKLLFASDTDDDFLDEPAAKVLANEIAEPTDLNPGDEIEHYIIEDRIGEGGMGEVYAARDTRLGRRVALKILAPHVTFDPAHIARFRQEAFATSALNHPNIVTIYEIAEWNGKDLIATEFIEGETLRSLITAGSLTPAKILDITAQIAAALNAAHEAGIYHRDIKPENIMVRPDGVVKVLDFGIAKYERDGETVIAMVKTSAGEIVGTAAYMSPEQARGLAVDGRTDIWSLGVILYEMLLGKLPFDGDTRSDRIAAILNSEIKPLAGTKMPGTLNRLIGKALSKDRDARFATMRDFAAELDMLRSASGNFAISGISGIHHARSKSSRLWKAAAIVLVFVLAAGTSGWYFLRNNKTNTPVLSQPMAINRIAGTSGAIEAAISPDGEFIAFTKRENGMQSLWLRQVSAASSIRIIEGGEGIRFGSPAFSSDGSYVQYLKVKANESRAGLYQTPKLGGSEQKLLDDISLQDSRSNFSISRDGRLVSYIQLDDGYNRSLAVSDIKGANKRTLISRTLPEYLTAAVLSPDASKIATISSMFGGRSGTGTMRIVLVNVSDGAEKNLGDKPFTSIEGITWSADGNEIIFSAGQRQGPRQLWRMAVDSGRLSRITNDLSDYSAPSITASSGQVVAVQSNEYSNLWLYETGRDESSGRQLTFGNGAADGRNGLAFIPTTGGIVYTAQASGNSDLWAIDSDGSNNRQLTNDSGNNLRPTVSPDGRHIVFNSDRTGEFTIWRSDIDGRNAVMLAQGSYPAFSPDGKWIFYYVVGSLFKVPIEGGTPVQIPQNDQDKAVAPHVSPDGAMIACNYLIGGEKAQFHIGIMNIEGGPPVKIFDTVTYAVKLLRWTPKGDAISFIETRNEVSNIVSENLSDSKIIPATNFTSGIIWEFDWSRDGKHLAAARGGVTTDIVLLKDFQ